MGLNTPIWTPYCCDHCYIYFYWYLYDYYFIWVCAIICVSLEAWDRGLNQAWGHENIWGLARSQTTQSAFQ